jgi:endonuclease YncB( thermonuclease family)
VVDDWEGTLQVVLFPTKGEKDWNKSINARLLESGLAATRTSDQEEIPDEVNKWYEIEEQARENQIGIWEYGGDIGDESD